MHSLLQLLLLALLSTMISAQGRGGGIRGAAPAPVPAPDSSALSDGRGGTGTRRGGDAVPTAVVDSATFGDTNADDLALSPTANANIDSICEWIQYFDGERFKVQGDDSIPNFIHASTADRDETHGCHVEFRPINPKVVQSMQVQTYFISSVTKFDDFHYSLEMTITEGGLMGTSCPDNQTTCTRTIEIKFLAFTIETNMNAKMLSQNPKCVTRKHTGKMHALFHGFAFHMQSRMSNGEKVYSFVDETYNRQRLVIQEDGRVIKQRVNPAANEGQVFFNIRVLRFRRDNRFVATIQTLDNRPLKLQVCPGENNFELMAFEEIKENCQERMFLDFGNNQF